MAHALNKHHANCLAGQRLLRTYRATKNGYGAGVYFDRDKQRLVRFSCCGPAQKRFLKRRGAEIVRHAAYVPHHGGYRRFFDYWWELY